MAFLDFERDGDTRPQTQAGTVFGGKHQRQERFMRGFECPDAVESGIVGKARHGGHLIQIVNEQSGIDLHDVPPVGLAHPSNKRSSAKDAPHKKTD